MTDTVNKAGDVNIKRIELINSAGFVVDITNQVVNIKIYEDLFSPFMAGSVVLLDAIDISSLLPLIGEERINIDVETPGSNTPIKQQFYLYKMSDKDRYNESSMVYVIHFMSLEAVVDANRKISKVFKGRNSDIVKKLLGADGFNTKKNVIIEQTRNSQAYISNYWSPAQNLSYVMEDAESMSGSPSYVFFENREGFVFSSLQSLYKVPPIGTFIEDSYVRSMTPDGKSIRNLDEEYARVKIIYTPELFNYLDRIQSGFYSSSLTTYDIVTKKYSVRIFDAAKKTSQTLNDVAMVSKASNYRADSMRMDLPKYHGNFNGYADVTNEASVQERISLLKQAESFKTQITIPGHTRYTVGRTLNLEAYRNAPVRESDNVADLIDPIVSGLYLISAICHDITRQEHICNLELIKDSILKGTK